MSKAINTILNLKDNFSSVLKKVSVNSTNFSKQLRGAEARANSLTKSISKFAKVAAGVTTAATGALIGSSIKTFENFEQAMANTAGILGISQKTIVNGIVKENESFKKLEEAALAAGKATTKTAEESANALGYMALKGWSVDESISGLMPILRLSEAAQSDLADTANKVTGAMAALGLKVADLPKVLDTATVANNKSGQTALELMEAYAGVGGKLKQLKTPLDESAALLGVLANREMKGSEAGNNLNSLLANLTKESGESYKAMKQLGIEAYDSEGKFKGITNVLKEVNEKTSSLTNKQRDLYLQMIGGKSQFVTLSSLMSGLNTTNEEGISELDELRQALQNTDGALETMAGTVNNTLHGAFSRLDSAIDDLKINIGKKISPYLTPLIEKLAEKLPNATEKFSEIVDKIIPKVESKFKEVAKVFSFLKEHMDIIIPAILGVSSAFASFIVITKVTSFAEKLGKTGGKFKEILKLLNLEMLANPFTWIAVAIGVLVAGLVIAYKKSEKFRNCVHALWEKIKQFGSGLKTISVTIFNFGKSLGEKLKPKLEKMGEIFKNLWSKIQEFGGKLTSKLAEVGQSFEEKIKPKLDKLGESIGNLWQSGLKPVIDGFKEGFKSLVEKLTPLVEGIGNGIKTLWDGVLKPLAEWLMPIFGANFEATFSFISSTISTVIETIEAVISGLITILTGVIDFLTGVFTGDWETAWNGIKEIFSGIVEGIGSVFKGIINGIINSINYFTGTLNWIPEKLSKLPGFSWAADFNIPKIPNFATGTQYFQGGLARINEHGGELVNLPNGSQIIPADKSQMFLDSIASKLENLQNSKNNLLNAINGFSSARNTINTIKSLENNENVFNNTKESENINTFNTTRNLENNKSIVNNTTNENKNKNIEVKVIVQGNMYGDESIIDKFGYAIANKILLQLRNM